MNTSLVSFQAWLIGVAVTARLDLRIRGRGGGWSSDEGFLLSSVYEMPVRQGPIKHLARMWRGPQRRKSVGLSARVCACGTRPRGPASPGGRMFPW